MCRTIIRTPRLGELVRSLYTPFSAAEVENTETTGNFLVIFSRALRRMKNLVNLDIFTMCTYFVDSPVDLYKGCREFRLRRLSFSNTTDDGHAAFLRSQAPTLQWLFYRGYFRHQPPDSSEWADLSFPQVRALRIDVDDAMSEKEWKGILDRCPRLEHIGIERQHREDDFTHNCLGALAAMGRSLRSVDLDAASPADLVALQQGCPNIEFISSLDQDLLDVSIFYFNVLNFSQLDTVQTTDLFHVNSPNLSASAPSKPSTISEPSTSHQTTSINSPPYERISPAFESIATI